MPPKASQIVLDRHGNGFLNGLVPDFARILDDQLSASSAFGLVLSERSYRGDRRIDKAMNEKHNEYLSR